MKTRTLVIAFLGLAALAVRAEATDWITAPSYFTHDPQSGERVQQYTPIGPFYTYPQGDYKRSAYHHTRSSIQAGGSADHLHIVEQWGGQPVRPYGEWRFPYRPYSVPSYLWTAPHFGYGFGYPPHHPLPSHRSGHDRGHFPPDSRGDRLNVLPYPGYHPQPWDDGRYPPYDSRGPYGYPDLLLREKDPFDLPSDDPPEEPNGA